MRSSFYDHIFRTSSGYESKQKRRKIFFFSFTWTLNFTGFFFRNLKLSTLLKNQIILFKFWNVIIRISWVFSISIISYPDVVGSWYEHDNSDYDNGPHSVSILKKKKFNLMNVFSIVDLNTNLCVQMSAHYEASKNQHKQSPET